MSVSFDILPRPKGVLEAKDLLKVELRPDKNRTFDARQNNGLLESNMPSDTSLEGEQTLPIQGAVLGTSNTPCNINLKKDVIGTGDTAHAHIQGGNIYLIRNLQHNRLDASENIDSTNMVTSKLTVGSFEVHRHQVNGLNYRLQLAQEKHGRVKIGLKNFYLSFNEGSQRKINQVLREFFAKDIVSVLARANRKYLLKNPAREKFSWNCSKNCARFFSGPRLRNTQQAH